MASTEQILKTARELGNMISEHDSAKRFEAVLKKLQDDTDAQRALNDYNRQMQALSEKEMSGQPIEVADKHKLQELKQAVALNPILGELQMVQMDYLDLMRRVDEAMSGPQPDAPAGVNPQAGSGPLVTE